MPPCTVGAVTTEPGQGPASAPPRDAPGRRPGLRSQTGRPIPARPDPSRPGLGLPPAPQARAVSAPPWPESGLQGLRVSHVRAEPAAPAPARPPTPGPPHSLSGRLGTLSRRRRCASPQCNFISSSATGHAHGARSPRTRMREGRSREGLPLGSAHARKRPSDRCRMVGRAASFRRLKEAPRLAPRRETLVSDQSEASRLNCQAQERESASSHHHNSH